MTRKHTSTHRRAGRRLVADMALAPAVIAMRLPTLFAEMAGTTPFRTESARAVAEKATAAAEGIFAAQLSLIASAARFWPEVMAGRVPSVVSGAAVERSLNAALAPAGRQVRANHKRLSGKPRR